MIAKCVAAMGVFPLEKPQSLLV